MQYLSRAPLRVSFAGGGTDVSPYPETAGGAVLSVAINRFCRAVLAPRRDGLVFVRSLDYGVSHVFPIDRVPDLTGPLALTGAVLRAAGDLGSGLDLVSASEAAPGSGLGASSALVVAILGAVRAWQGRPWTNAQLAELAYRVERIDLGLSGGRQDQYAAVFGGLNFLEFLPGRTIVNRLQLPRGVDDGLKASLLLCYTGKGHPNEDLIGQQVASFRAGERKVVAALEHLKELAVVMKQALERGDLESFAGLLAQGWEHKKALADGISDPAIDRMYQAALDAGALGGKLLGSGGGGHLLLFCPPSSRARVVGAVQGHGCREVPFDFSPGGVEATISGGDPVAS
ncbi:MAG: GHMP kinase [Bacillota bacterium]|nr:GHMP kinase [Bacillota bacterium]